MYSIKLDKRVEKFLMSHSDIGIRFFEKTKILMKSPFDPRLDVKKLINTHGKYRLRIGKYRFLFEIIDHLILIYIYDADSRGGIYS